MGKDMARKIPHHEVPHFFLIQLIQPLCVKELEIMPKIKQDKPNKNVNYNRRKQKAQRGAYSWGMRGILGSLCFAGAPCRIVCLKYSDSE